MISYIEYAINKKDYDFLDYLIDVDEEYPTKAFAYALKIKDQNIAKFIIKKVKNTKQNGKRNHFR
jgi:hypothetical protein